jgi:hypothetical protein
LKPGGGDAREEPLVVGGLAGKERSTRGGISGPDAEELEVGLREDGVPSVVSVYE